MSTRCGISKKSGRCVYRKGPQNGKYRLNGGEPVCELSVNERCQLTSAGRRLNAVERKNLASGRHSLGFAITDGDNRALINMGVPVQNRRRNRRNNNRRSNTTKTSKFMKFIGGAAAFIGLIKMIQNAKNKQNNQRLQSRRRSTRRSRRRSKRRSRRRL